MDLFLPFFVKVEKDVGWLVGVSWHINPCELFNAKFCLYVYI